MIPKILMTVVLLSCICHLSAQRAVRVIDPQAVDDTLVFDTNEIPVNAGAAFRSDFNFAPRVIYTPDSSKAFVSFPGTNKVVAFDPQSGAILDVIAVRTNPTQLAITPDGRKLAVPCIFLKENLPTQQNPQGGRMGSIAIIDVETHQVQNIDFNNTLFSIANNIVFAPDGTGIVAVSGSDQLLRFDVESASEVGARISFLAGTRPTSITLSKDGSFIGVVLVGSNFLSRLETPDSVQIIDLATFTVRDSLGFPPPENQLAFDFRAANTVAFSEDGTMAFIADQANSQRAIFDGLPGEFAQDRGLLIDLESSELIGAFALGGALTGGISGRAFTTPDGRFFVTLTAQTINVVDIQNQTMLTTTPFFSNFQAGTQPAFRDDSEVIYLASPLSDFLLAFRPSTGEVFRNLSMGGVVERMFQDQMIMVPSAPLDTTLTPDQRLIATVNFNANTIEVFKPTFPLYAPEFITTSGFGTGIAVTNVLESDAEVVLTAVGRNGQILTDNDETEENVEFAFPQTRILKPFEQLSGTAVELLQPDPAATSEGWLDLDSDNRGLAGIFMSFDSAVIRLDGGSFSTRTLQRTLIPVVRIVDGFNTEIDVVNPNVSGSVNAVITLFDNEGMQVVQSSPQLISAGNRSTFLIRDPDPMDPTVNGLFADSVLQDFVDGYATVVTSGGGLLAYERIFDPLRLAVLNGQSLQSTDVTSGFQTFTVPHFVVFGGNDTILNLVHQDEEEALLTMTLRDDMGAPLADPVELMMAPQSLLRRSVIELFGLEGSDEALAGWIEIQSSKPNLLGNYEILAFNGRAMTASPIQAAAFKEFVFPHVAQAIGLTTGLALLNNGDADALVQVALRRTDGSLVQQIEVLLAPGQRLIGLVPDLFPTLAEDLFGGTLHVTSDQPLTNLELFFSANAELLSAVPAHGIR